MNPTAVTDQVTKRGTSDEADRRFQWAGLAALLLLCFLVYLPGLSRPAGFYHDDAIYMLTGRALARGQGYRIVSLPGAPPQTKYPPLFPALLSVLWRIVPQFPACVAAFRITNILLWLAALALSYDLLVRFRYAPPRLALVIIALRGLSLDAAHMTELVITESLVTLLVTGCLWYTEFALASNNPRDIARRTTLSGLLLGLAILTHSAVVLLWLGFAIAQRAQRAPGLIWMSVTALPTFVGWTLWARQAGHLPGWDLRSYYLDYLGWVGHQYRLIPPSTVFAANIQQLVLFTLPAHILPFETDSGIRAFVPHGFTWFLAMFGLIVTGLTALGGWTLWRQGRSLFPLVVLTLTLPGCAWPAGGGRYTFPAGVICLYLAVRGGQVVLSRSGRWARPLSAAAMLAMLLSVTLTAAALADRMLHSGQPSRKESVEDWVRTHVPLTDAVCARDDARIFLTTGRQGISDRAWMGLTWNGLTVDWHGRPGYCPDANRQRVLLESLGVRWLIDAGPPHRPHGWGTPSLLQAHPEWFSQVYVSRSGDFRVYRWR